MLCILLLSSFLLQYPCCTDEETIVCTRYRMCPRPHSEKAVEKANFIDLKEMKVTILEWILNESWTNVENSFICILVTALYCVCSIIQHLHGTKLYFRHINIKPSNPQLTLGCWYYQYCQYFDGWYGGTER